MATTEKVKVVDWIPAFAGMTNREVLPAPVIPARAGIQYFHISYSIFHISKQAKGDNK